MAAIEPGLTTTPSFELEDLTEASVELRAAPEDFWAAYREIASRVPQNRRRSPAA